MGRDNHRSGWPPERLRIAGVIGLTAGLVAVLLIFWPRSSPSPRPPPTPPAPPLVVSKAAVAEPGAAEAVPAVPEAFVPTGPAEEAAHAVAASAGWGVVRCPLPVDAPPGVPQGPWRMATRERDHVVGVVSHPVGAGVLTPPLPAANDFKSAKEWFAASADLSTQWFGAVLWTAAWPGEIGDCQLQPIRTVEVHGWLTDAEGGPVVDGRVYGCEQERNARSRDDGGFTARILDLPGCELSAFSEGARARATYGGDPGRPIHLQLAAWEPDPAFELTDENHGERLEQALRPDPQRPAEMALADPNLSSEAREIVRGWHDDQMDLIRMTLEVVDPEPNR